MEKGLEIEIFANGGPLCPVKAWRRYRKLAPEEDEEMPAFRQEDGLAYSHSLFNRDLKRIFEGRINYGTVSAHSFR